MKKTIILLCLLTVCSFGFAQEQDTLQPSKWKMYWKLSGIVGLKVSQTQLVNWAAGGNSNFAGIAYVNATLNYKKQRYAWDTNLDTDLGAIYSSDFKYYQWRKGNDKFNFSTLFGYAISAVENKDTMWYIAANGSFKSQYMNGYIYPDSTRTKVSGWLSPSYTELSAGINWRWKNIFSIYCSPVAGLITSCTDPLLRETYGVHPNKSVHASLGLTFRAGVTYEGVKNLKILSSLQLYSPYTDQDQKFGNFNIDWDVIITYQFLKVLNVSLTTNLKYYHKVLFPESPKRRVQFQEIFGLGIAYSF